MLSPEDDRLEVASAIERLRFAGFNVLHPEVFALAVRAARDVADSPPPQIPSLYKWGEIRRRQQAQSVVYYARIGNRVKIGYTIDIQRRMSAINPEEILATEPGGPKIELERHRQFASLRVHGEWFRLEEPLVSHIAALRS